MRKFIVTLQNWTRRAEGSTPEEAFKSLGYDFPIKTTPKGKGRWSIEFKNVAPGHSNVYTVEETFND